MIAIRMLLPPDADGAADLEPPPLFFFAAIRDSRLSVD
jgi:hypothetical protein